MCVMRGCTSAPPGPAPDGTRPPRRLRRSGWTPDFTRVSGLDARNLEPLVAFTPSASARYALEGAPAKPATLIGCFVEEKHAFQACLSVSLVALTRDSFWTNDTRSGWPASTGARGCAPQKLTGGWGPLPVGSALGSPRPPATPLGGCAFGASDCRPSPTRQLSARPLRVGLSFGRLPKAKACWPGSRSVCDRI